ncbi:MAG: patatin-like phospholipase family protein [Gammaproteobacteria bacterium]|nr:patatin-like phospholipase family protein [Gammaproteobacteria bacterium]
MNRRDFLKLGLATSLLASCDAWKTGDKLGLALGGGGARGLAHILMLEVLDDLRIRPHRIAGTSIGAVFGTMYAAGMSGREIREVVDRLTVSKNESWLSGLFEQDLGRWWDLINLKLGSGGLIDSSAFAGFIRETTGVSRFDQLGIPLKIVAADFWEREAVIFETGNLSPAIQASIAIPGLFSPVQHNGRVLVDGGLVNPLPYDLLFDDCDVVVAIDVSGNRNPKTDNGPGYFETVFNTMQITQAAILREKMKLRPPHIYIRPGLEDIRVFDFNRVDEIYQQSKSAANKLRQALRQRYPD